SLITPMVLRNSGRVGSRRFFSDGSSPSVERPEGMTCFIQGEGKGAPGCPVSTLTPGVGKVGYK
ncbi:hypothetical protein, partial [Bacteroides fragilis]|uniref:hypothetical protein n=1 Tax=Bacteroides fragilis TaxID=817 RepID=UPI001E474D4A